MGGVEGVRWRKQSWDPNSPPRKMRFTRSAGPSFFRNASRVCSKTGKNREQPQITLPVPGSVIINGAIRLLENRLADLVCPALMVLLGCEICSSERDME